MFHYLFKFKGVAVDVTSLALEEGSIIGFYQTSTGEIQVWLDENDIRLTLISLVGKAPFRVSNVPFERPQKALVSFHRYGFDSFSLEVRIVVAIV